MSEVKIRTYAVTTGDNGEEILTRVFTVEQASRILHITPNWLYTLERTGAIKSVVDNKRLYIPEPEIRRWHAEKHRTKARSEWRPEAPVKSDSLPSR